MKVLGFFIVLFAFRSLSVDGFQWTEILWFVFGTILLTIKEGLEFFARTERFVHRSNSNVKK